MALPVISAITFDKTSYLPGDTITATVHYAVTNVHGVSYTLTGTVTDNVTGEANSLNATFSVGTPNAASAAVSGGESGQAWTRVSDDGKSAAVFTAKAI